MKIPFKFNTLTATTLFGAVLAGIVLSAWVNAATTAPAQTKYPATAIFAGGCFWCMEQPFEKLDGVGDVISGYIGGHVVNPSYKQVSSGTSGHVEAVKIPFDPNKISYAELLDVYWRQIDPTDAGGSFVDRGSQYRSAIFYVDAAQKAAAMSAIKKLNASGFYPKPIVTEVRPATPFYPAEDYHQDYGKNNPIRYHFYRYRSGRDQYLEKQWAKEDAPAAGMHTGTSKSSTMKMAPMKSAPMMTKESKKMSEYRKPSKEELQQRLTELQFKVTQEEGTEAPFQNTYWNNKQQGIYVDIVSGEPLFSSVDKYDSHTGWPSFTQPIDGKQLVEKEDRRLFSVRTEVRSPLADSHLGHVFDDGPAPTGKRYCINSAALRFIPKEELEAQGYGQYLGKLGI